MRVTEIDIQGEFGRLKEAFEAFEGMRSEGPEACRERAPEVSGWSTEQHLYHIALATDLAFKHIRSLVTGKGRLIQPEGSLGERAAEILAQDRSPRGEAQAPRMVTPDAEVNPEFLEMEQRLNREGLAKLEELAAEIPAAAGWIHHQDLGPLAAAHWLRFSALHARHHLAIVKDIRAAGKA